MTNGKNLPTIHVLWDQEKQTAFIEINPEEFKTWELVLAALTIAVNHAEFNVNVGRMAALQQQQQEAAQQMVIRQKLQL